MTSLLPEILGHLGHFVRFGSLKQPSVTCCYVFGAPQRLTTVYRVDGSNLGSVVAQIERRQSDILCQIVPLISDTNYSLFKPTFLHPPVLNIKTQAPFVVSQSVISSL